MVKLLNYNVKTCPFNFLCSSKEVREGREGYLAQGINIFNKVVFLEISREGFGWITRTSPGSPGHLCKFDWEVEIPHGRRSWEITS